MDANASLTNRRWLAAAAFFAVICAMVDCWPHHGPPHFRYTGSDPARSVWNIGWPLAMAIHDPQSGLHIGPVAYVAVAAQGTLFVAGCLCFAAATHVRRRRKVRQTSAVLPAVGSNLG